MIGNVGCGLLLWYGLGPSVLCRHGCPLMIDSSE